MSLIVTHTLAIDAEPVSNSDLSDKLHSFWELESLGTERVEKSVHNKFKEKYSLRNGRYEVSLPSKEFHDPLQDTYVLSLRRLEGLIR